MTEAAAPKPSEGRVGAPRLALPARLLSDERLARRATGGDPAAFEAIFQRYHQDLYRFCLATTGNVQDAQDALQNTMVKVMRALPGEERQIKLKPWLYRIARNESVETLRRRRDGSELEPEQMAASWEIAETAEARERLRGLLVDLKELPERQRAALLMRELAGLDFAEIGETFGTSAAVARQTLYEARLSLRQMQEGREMSCETVMKALSDADGRVTRRRDVRAHLRHCDRCRAFRDGIATRREELAAIAPIPLVASLGLLQGVLASHATAGSIGAAAGVGTEVAAGAAGAGAGGIGGALGAGAAKIGAASVITKSAATVAVVAAVGVSAERSGVVDVPLPGQSTKPAGESSRRGSQGTPAHSSQPSDQRAQVGGQPGSPASDPAAGRKASGAKSGKTAPSHSAKGIQRKAADKPARPPRHGSGAPRSGGRPQAAPPGGKGQPARATGGRQAAGMGKPPQATQPSPPPSNSGSSGKAKPAPPPAAAPPTSEGTPVPPTAPGPVSPVPGEAAIGESAPGGVEPDAVETPAP